jgi:LEA14-like dessication related protein
MSCDVLSGVASFVNCKYEFSGISDPAVAGISLKDVTDITKLSASSLLKLTTGLMSGSLPLSVTVNIKTTNPNSTAAKIAGLDWAIDMDASNVLSGTLNHAVTVPPNGGQSNIPLTIQTDVLQLFKNESKDNILNFVNHLLNTGKSSSKISVRIRPSVMIGTQKISTGYITLK